VRILQLIQELGIGGAERMTAALVSGARGAGHDVAVAAADGPFAATLGVPIFLIPMVRRRIRRLPAAVSAVRRAVRAWRPDVVHCHNPGMALAFTLATLGGSRCRALVTIEGLEQRDYRYAARFLRWSGLPAVACGPGVAAQLGDPGVPLLTIANGVSAPPPRAERANLEKEWPCLRGRDLVVAAGRLVARKDFAAVIEAFAQVPAAALVIIGDGPERASLERRAIEVGVGDRVILAGFRSDLREIVGAAAAFMIASHWEGLPLVVLEALAAGRPVVAVRAPWQEGFLTDGDDCLLAEPNDAGDLAGAVRRVLGDRALASRLSVKAARRAAAYTEEMAVGHYLRLYHTLLSQ
jgi:glycosyltransferase involved in cell wall biosynthesis